jgi:hypothetical protein
MVFVTAATVYVQYHFSCQCTDPSGKSTDARHPLFESHVGQRRTDQMQSIHQVLREEIRALHIEEALSGYVLACCMDDEPVEEVRELLFARVLSMTGPALRKTEEQCGVALRDTGKYFLHVLAEEIHWVIELCIWENVDTLDTARKFVDTQVGAVN